MCESINLKHQEAIVLFGLQRCREQNLQSGDTVHAKIPPQCTAFPFEDSPPVVLLLPVEACRLIYCGINISISPH